MFLRQAASISRFFDNVKKGIKGKRIGFPKFQKDCRSVEYKTNSWKLAEDRKSITFTDKCGIGRLKMKGTRDQTAGVDGVKSPTPKQRLDLIDAIEIGTKVKPTRRVWIPKPGTEEKRPLGNVPTAITTSKMEIYSKQTTLSQNQKVERIITKICNYSIGTVTIKRLLMMAVLAPNLVVTVLSRSHQLRQNLGSGKTICW
jgi:hypothetical protein